jgi:hypothetical protein
VSVAGIGSGKGNEIFSIGRKTAHNDGRHNETCPSEWKRSRGVGESKGH